MAFSRINYTEPKQGTYRSIELGYRENGKEKTVYFDTGNFVVDYYDYMLFLAEVPDKWHKENFHVTGSSSWDHFFMDGNKYRESYFDPETGEFLDWRAAWDNGDFELFHEITDSGKYPRVMHLPCHKNFHDVKIYYRRKKLEPIKKHAKLLFSKK